ncbi:hypothetical protein [Variovorax paradoxus]|uniref:hypothetical protein n=1 Tax=Variovorax paradoxus TaxID=34073 RepID=UPI001932FD68|nr:hypothetical protein INQ48_13840 [Variovorax paradoxus]
MASIELIQAVAVTAELCGRTFSEAAARMFVQDLSLYPEAAVLGALTRCRREVRGVLTVQDVVSRLDDGRPGVDEAWAMLPFDEQMSVVWTDEMSAAFGVVRPLLREGDRTAARFAFREAYAKAVNAARDAARPVSWWASLGHDLEGQSAVLREAVDKGRLTLQQAQEKVPQLPGAAKVAALALGAIARIEVSHDH